MSDTVQKKSENVLYLSDVVSSKDNNLGGFNLLSLA